MHDLYTTKTSYMFLPPTSFPGLAVTDQNVARACIGRRSSNRLRSFNTELIRKLLRPGAEFREDLETFIGCANRRTLREESQKVIARQWFKKNTETSIERKHAMVAMAQALRRMGGVKVSPANRMGMLEQWLGRGHTSGGDLLRCVDKARSVCDCPEYLGLERHPELISGGELRSTSYRKVLGRVSCRCDIVPIYHGAGAAQKKHASSKRKESTADAKIMDKAKHQVSNNLVLMNMMQDHACPAIVVELHSLESQLRVPTSKRIRLKQEEAPALVDALEPGVEGIESEQSVIYFKFAYTRIGDKQAPRVAPGVGCKLAPDDCTVGIYRLVGCLGDRPVIDAGTIVGNVISSTRFSR